MAPRVLKVGLVSLCGCSVVNAVANTTTVATTTTTTTTMRSGPLSLLDGSVNCRKLPCIWANSERDPKGSCPAGDCVWSDASASCSPSVIVNQAMAVAAASSNMIALFGNASFGRMMQAGVVCPTKAQAACTGDCRWNTENGTAKCDPDPSKWLADLMSGPLCAGKQTQQECESGGCLWVKDVTKNPATFECTPSKADTMRQYDCRATTTPLAPPPTRAPSSDSFYCRMVQCAYANTEANKQASCTGDCEWQASTSNCSMSASLMMEQLGTMGNMTLMFGNRGPAGRMMATMENCQGKPQASCSGDCTWEPSRGMCSISMAAMMQVQSAYPAESREAEACTGDDKNTQEACRAAGCVWLAPMNSCMPKKATTYTLYGCGATRAAASAASELRSGAASLAALAVWVGAQAAGLA